MGVMPVKKLVLNMSLPMMASMLVQALYNIVDSVFVSMLSEQALTAVSLAVPAQNLMIGLATGMGVGMNALLSRALGAKDHDRAQKAAESGLILAVLGSVLFIFFGLFLARPFFAAQTTDANIIEMGTQYISICCCLSTAVFLAITFERLLQATGRSFYTMITQGVGAIVNIVMDPICIFVLDMGVAGAAVATVAGQVVSMSLGLYYNRKYNPEVQVRFRKLRPDFRMMWQIVRIGFPSVLMMAIGSVMTFCMNKILILYTVGKETAATVFGVYFKLNSFIFMPIFGLNNGVVPIVAYNYGAQNRRRMMEAIKFSVTISVSIMTFGMIIFELAPHLLLSIFEASDNMMSIGIPALRIIATTFPIAGGTIILGTVFQALGKSMYSMLTSFMRQLVALVPSAYVLARIGMVNGNQDLVWWSYPIAEVVSLAATMVCFGMIYRDIIKPIPEEGEKLA